MPKRINGSGALETEYASGHVFHRVAAQTSGLSAAQAQIFVPKEARLVHIEVAMSGQTLMLAAGGGGAQMDLAVNWTKHDGTSGYNHPGQSTAARGLLDGNPRVGNWNATIRMMKNVAGDAWVGHISAFYTATSGDNIWGHGSDYYRFSGRFITYQHANQHTLRFATRPGETGQTFIEAVGYW